MVLVGKRTTNIVRPPIYLSRSYWNKYFGPSSTFPVPKLLQKSSVAPETNLVSLLWFLECWDDLLGLVCEKKDHCRVGS